MPLARGLSQGLSVGIPLAVKKFALDQEQFKFEQLMKTKQDNLELARNELQEEKRTAKIKVLTESAKEFAEAGDQKGLSSIHEQLVGLGQMGLPEVPGMSPEVLDIAQQLRGEGGVPLEEGIPRKFYTPPTPFEEFKKEKELEHGFKTELEKLKQGGKTKKGDISKTSEAYLTKQLAEGNIDWETYVKRRKRIATATRKPGADKDIKTEKNEKKLKGLKTSYEKTVGRYNAASMGVGQFIPDPNRQVVADQEKKRAVNLAIQYKKSGGNPEDLGITADGIKKDYQDKKISKEHAVRLLKELFEMK